MGVFLAESMLVAAMGAIIGVIIAWASIRMLLGLYGNTLPRAEQVGVLAPVLACAVLLALVVGVLVGLMPALRARIDNSYDALRAGSRSGTVVGTRLQRALVVAEVAVAVVPPTDLTTMSAVASVALLTALVASYLPAFGASRPHLADVLRR